ncbi:hypothetical protein [Paraburkholderia tagetis]|uniref:hypothetical protein n=1 Tax=Paraburkholderia tagetis TaxID=2913261 RepID=UPI001EE43C85|nr:hypothetical protein [Paraburkholderia tagetis]
MTPVSSAQHLACAGSGAAVFTARYKWLKGKLKVADAASRKRTEKGVEKSKRGACGVNRMRPVRRASSTKEARRGVSMLSLRGADAGRE